ncbi:MAG: alpha/beta hydrolase, partial [Pseudomonadota bacterium]
PASPVDTVTVFVDANGTFYPNSWDAHLTPRRRWPAHSLLNESADDPDFRQLIESDAERQIKDLSSFGAGKSRLFILVHGYNNSMEKAELAYKDIEEKIDFKRDDGIILFYWDGLVASGAGPAKIWFNATGYSQLAGSRGLRRVLASFSGKEVFLITHSRGTSVVLSAFGNPVYDPEFLRHTSRVAESWGDRYQNFLNPEPLRSKGNKFHVFALAPAVDRIDFCDESEQRQTRFNCSKMRSLPMVQSFRYTVNTDDPILNKFVGLSGGFNPTGLGVNTEVGLTLRAEFTFLEEYLFDQPEEYHAFRSYVANPTFDAMLKDAGLRAE